jgi:uncharacterized membrane protein YhaH (DUF805 family)
MKYLAGRTNRATFAALMLLCSAVGALAVAFQIRIPGETFFIFVCAPRLHDLGRSGWWIVFLVICESAAAIAIMTWLPQMGISARAATGLGALAALVVLYLPAIILLFISGQRGPNRFGDAPAPGVGWASMVRSS